MSTASSLTKATCRQPCELLDAELEELSVLSLYAHSSLSKRSDAAVSRARSLGDGARLARALCIRSNVLVRSGDAAGAIESAHHAVRVAEGGGHTVVRIEALGTLAVVISHAGAHQEALRFIELAQCIPAWNANLGWLRFRLGLVLYQLGDATRAAEAFESATPQLVNDPRLPHVWLSLASARAETGDLQASHAALQLVQDHLAASYDGRLKAVSVAVIAQVEARTGHPDLAMQTLVEHEHLAGHAPAARALANLACASELNRQMKLFQAADLLESMSGQTELLPVSQRLDYLALRRSVLNDPSLKALKASAQANVDALARSMSSLKQSSELRAMVILQEFLEARLEQAKTFEESRSLRDELEALSQRIESCTEVRASVERTFQVAMERARGTRPPQLVLGMDLTRQGFSAVFQPIVASDGTVLALQALTRYEDADGSTQLPHEFFRDLQRNGDCVVLGDWMIRQALQLVESAADFSLSLPVVYVKVFDRQLIRSDFAVKFVDLMHSDLIFQGGVGVELPEWVLSSESLDVRANVAYLKANKVPIAVGNYGAQSSSFWDLSDLRPSLVKLSPSFLSRLEAPEKESSLKHFFAGISLVCDRVVQVGVESQSELNVIHRLGVEASQGFVHAPPLPAPSILRHLLNGRTGASAGNLQAVNS